MYYLFFFSLPKRGGGLKKYRLTYTFLINKRGGPYKEQRTNKQASKSHAYIRHKKALYALLRLKTAEKAIPL